MKPQLAPNAIILSFIYPYLIPIQSFHEKTNATLSILILIPEQSLNVDTNAI